MILFKRTFYNTKISLILLLKEDSSVMFETLDARINKFSLSRSFNNFATNMIITSILQKCKVEPLLQLTIPEGINTSDQASPNVEVETELIIGRPGTSDSR